MGCTQSQSTSKGQNISENLISEKKQDFREIYDVEKQIGEGSISNIYLVHKKTEAVAGSAKNINANFEVKRGATYALKEIDLDLVNPTFMQEMRNEIDLLRTLDHPNIIRAFEVYQNGANHISIVMELCAGGDVNKKAPFTESQASTIVRQLVAALFYLHRRKVMHR